VRIKDVIIDVVIVAVVIVVFTTFIKPIIVDGDSMNPTLKDRDYLFLSRLAYKTGEPQRGQIVVFPPPNAPDELYIKRVVGLPGETVEIRGGEVYVNGVRQDQSFTKDGYTGAGIDAAVSREGRIKVPKGELFVMGDNRNNSEDSRFIGCIKISDVKGVAVLRLWPLNKFGTLKKEP
jgi:signal peptidase I